MITREELIKKYLKFFESKKHKVIPSASLVPENDPTTLFISAGMQPLVPYLLGQRHPLGKRIVDVQKCIRTTDIDEVGDTTHHTFFEMLGNWSFGDYWKKEAIEWSFEFLTKELKIPINKLSVSCFAGDENAKRDEESAKIWLSLGIPKERLAFLGKKDNWWGPAGETGPCGPDTEMFYWKNSKIKPPKIFNPKDENWVEIWNDVFMEYVKNKDGKILEAKQKNVDTGMGVERTIAVLNGLEDDYEAEMWKPIIEEIEKISGEKYHDEADEKTKKAFRVVVDHVKAAVFILGEGVIPSNTDRGYVLRRLIRRAVRYGRDLVITNFTRKVAEPIFDIYQKDYSELKKNKLKILDELEKEEKRFLQTLENGMKIFYRLVEKRQELTGKEAFLLYQSYGFPLEMIEEEAEIRNIDFSRKEFEKEMRMHQELSRTATKGKFAAGLTDSSEQSTKYHTATHMLHKALKVILGNEVQQMGSNITQERLRFDFNFSRKLTDEEIKKIEDLVNKQIKRSLDVGYEEMSYEKAVKSGALSYFREKYPPVVKVYSVGDFSREICTGPHVQNTGTMGKFKITKEEAISAGVRRIKAILEENFITSPKRGQSKAVLE